MTRFFIHRPIFSAVIALIMVLAGAVAAFTLPISQFPQIVPPTVQVTSTFNGADAQTVADAVTLPMEQQINGVEGMLYMSSNSTSTGASVITVTFEVGYDLNIAAVDVLNRVQQAMPQLPQQVQALGVDITKQSTNLTLVVSLESPDGQYDSRFLSNFANIVVQPALARIDGVGSITVFGLEQYSMRVWLDAERLAAMGISTTDVVAAVQAQNQQAAIGLVGAEPSVGDPGFTISLVTLGRLDTVQEFEDIVVRTGDNGAVVRIRDIGKVEIGSYQYSSTSTLNGQGTGTIGIYQLPTANAYQVAQNVRKEMDRLSDLLPPGVDYRVTYDSTLFVSASLKDLVKTLFEAAGLVLLTIFIFLQDWRATLIPMIAIPVSIIGTFAVMMAFGFSINTLTLLGLVLAIGLVVDDAIVVVENVYHQLEMGAPDSKVAAERAMKEVSGPIIATSLVLMAVFIPAALMPGITGQLYNQFALTIAFSIALSSINSLTLSPALCGVFLKKAHEAKWKPFVLFNRGFDRMRDHYADLVHWLGRHWYIVLVAFAAGVVAVVMLLQRTSTAFIPNEDQGVYFTAVQLPSGASLPRTEQVCAQVREIIKRDSAVVDVIQVAGYNFLTGTAETNAAFLIATLKPWDDRNPATENAGAIIRRAYPAMHELPDAQVIPVPPPPIPGLGTAGGWQLQVEDINSQGFEALGQAATAFMDGLSKRPELASINTPFRYEVPIVRVSIDRIKAQLLGLNITEVFATMGQTLGQSFVNNFNLFGQVYNVMVQADALDRMKVTDILGLYVRNDRGEMVPLSAFCTLSVGVATDNATHYNLFNTVQVIGSSGPGYGSGDAIRAVAEVAKETLPEGFSYEWTGTVYQEIEAGGYAPIVFGMAIIAVFLLLAAQYESWVLPFNVLLAVLFAVLGGLTMLHIRHHPLDTYAQIGMVMLVGLAAKNAILIVEFAKTRHESGESVIDAAKNASRQRLRPILMTSIAFILGILPLFIAIGAGAASRRSIGTVVLGGMLGAVVVDQLVVPTLFVMLESLREKVLGKRPPSPSQAEGGAGGEGQSGGAGVGLGTGVTPGEAGPAAATTPPAATS